MNLNPSIRWLHGI